MSEPKPDANHTAGAGYLLVFPLLPTQLWCIQAAVAMRGAVGRPTRRADLGASVVPRNATSWWRTGSAVGRGIWKVYGVSGRVAALGSLGYLLARACCGRRRESRPRRRPSRADCQPVPRTVYRRADPLIYSQAFLLAHGLSVTWNNPDIRLERFGSVVHSHALAPETEYEIVARIWNGSLNAPAPGLAVRFSFLTFGIGQESTLIGVKHVDLGVKGSAYSPAFARHAWVTPPAGHYCIQVELDWPDDANPGNNLGQENVDVLQLESPHASTRFPLRNAARIEQTLLLEADGYALGSPGPCDEPPVESADMSEHERRERMRQALEAHGRKGTPRGWSVEITPSHVLLGPGESHEVQVEVFAPDGFEGRQPININAFAGSVPVGGVTLYVEGSS